MASKIARNESCPCGSGKKYKNCHGSVDNSAWESANERSVVMQFRFESITLTRDSETGPVEITVTGALDEEQNHYPFVMVAEPRAESTLMIKQFGWQRRPPITDKEAVARQLLRHLGNCLRPLKLRAQHDDESPTGLSWRSPGQGEDANDAHQIILRPGLSRIPGTPWSTLWDRIYFKIKGDPLFSVTGFTLEQVEAGLRQLQQVFDSQWIETVFRQALGEESRPTMTSDLPLTGATAWFPAYHLSRMASGVICRDPVLNSLVELGLALQCLKDLPGLAILQRSLADRPALQHQVCFAADLLQAGFDQVQARDAFQALQVIVDDQPYLIQTEEVGLKNLADNIAAHLTPAEVGHPRILQLVVSDGSWYEPDAALPEELEDLAIPSDILAVVISRRFLDTGGGRLKRNVQKILHNNRSVHLQKVNSAGWEKLFVANYEQYAESALNVGTYFYLQ